MGQTKAKALVIGRLDALRAFLSKDDRPDVDGVVVAERTNAVSVDGVPIVGTTAELEHAVNVHDARTIYVAEPWDDLGLSLGRLSRLRRGGRRVVRPAVADEWIDIAPWTPSKDDPAYVKTLIGRDHVDLCVEDVEQAVRGATVLVTGAGGSIGSEVCMQVATLGCARLVMLEVSEHNLFTIERRVRAANPNLSIVAKLCDIRDRRHVTQTFLRERPTLVLHTAALKHVPMVEEHPAQGVLTNFFGTRNVVEACQAAGVRAMAFISTDKAVQPASVMGLSKRLAEEYVRGRDLDGLMQPGSTRFVSVRFGNVLGTSGSVVPIFREQIEAGGPVTVTHADMERYFMTPQEAVRLTLRATALALRDGMRECGLYVLEMGDPVRIMDFARRMIQAHGYTPGRDIAIVVSEPRAGEKITEVLIDDDETGGCSNVPGVMQVVSEAPNLSADLMARLEAAATDNDDALVVRLLDELRLQRRKVAVA